jgi:hypothetical protein
MRTTYTCDHCGVSYNIKEECAEHESKCMHRFKDKIVILTLKDYMEPICGRVHSLDLSRLIMLQYDRQFNQIHVTIPFDDIREVKG